MSKTGQRYAALTANIGAKLVSLAFAVLLWLHVTAQQSEVQSLRVPLVLGGIPDSLTVSHGLPRTIDVTIRGSRMELFKLRLFGRLRAQVNLSEAVQGRNTIPLGAAILNLPEEFDPRDVVVEDPKVLVLNFEPVVTRLVPVRVVWKGDVPHDALIDGPASVVPPRVQVTGASSVVGGIDSLPTREIDLRGRWGRHAQEIEIAHEGRQIRVAPERVLVEVSIQRRLSRTLAGIPPTLLQDRRALSVEYSPQLVSLTIEGPEDLIRDVAASDVSVILNLAGRPPGRHRIEPEVIVPRGIVKYFLDVDAFEIMISSASRGGEPRED